MPIRVMLVDDSAVVRHVVTKVISSEADMAVVGTASNGRDALTRIETSSPDVVVLDVEMPLLDGLGTLRELRARWRELPVIMYSTVTARCASATLDALSLGANDYATKPAAGGLEATVRTVREQLVPQIRAWASGSGRRCGTSKTEVQSRLAPGRSGRIDAVVIGASAGGPNALGDMVPRLPADLPVPVLVTQHMPETFTRLLASRLDATSAISVVEAEDGMPIEKGRVYVAKGGSHLEVAGSPGRLRVALSDGPPENFCRPAVDVMFRSAARAWGRGLLAVVLTGMGRDGVNGCSEVAATGGAVLTQDRDTSLVWGMPGAVVDAGLSSASLPLSRIAVEVTRRALPGLTVGAGS